MEEWNGRRSNVSSDKVAKLLHGVGLDLNLVLLQDANGLRSEKNGAGCTIIGTQRVSFDDPRRFPCTMLLLM